MTVICQLHEARWRLSVSYMRHDDGYLQRVYFVCHLGQDGGCLQGVYTVCYLGQDGDCPQGYVKPVS